MSPEHADRSPSTSRVGVAMVVALVALASFLAISATASAAFPERSSAQNIRSLKLKLPVRPGASACKVRTIDLAAGRYRWQAAFNLGLGWTATVPRTIPLRAGRYTWIDCIVGYTTGRSYNQYSYLNGPSRPSRKDSPSMGWTDRFGTYDHARFGSTLKRL